MTLSKKIRNRIAAMVEPPPRLKVSEWADKEAWIPAEGNAEPGKYRLSRMPHQAAMLDDPIEPGVGEVYWMLASQAGGKTLALILLTEFVIRKLRRSVIVARATKETATEWMRDKFLPTVEATPCMDGLLAEPRKRGSNSTSLNRKFPGGGLKVIGAKSPAAFRGSSAGILLADEVDSWMTLKEGDPLSLLDRASITFSDAWKVRCSTPTLKGFSKIAHGYERGDKQKYFVPCPCCGHFQELKFDQLKFSFTKEEYEIIKTPEKHPSDYQWKMGKFEEMDMRRAIYVCDTCQRGWVDSQRIQAYMSGHSDNAPVKTTAGDVFRADWRATAPFKGVRSRHLSGMYLTIGLEKDKDNYLHQFAANFLKAKSEGRETLMVWTNIFKSEPFDEPGEVTDWNQIKKRAEDFGPTLPPQVCWINFGCDVHPDRVEILWFGWGYAEEVWVIDRHIEYGDFVLPGMQERVESYILGKRFTHPIIGQMGFSAGGMDSGHQTKVKEVYQFCGKHRLSNIYSVKGFDSALGATFQSVKEKTCKGLRFNLNTDHYKNTIFERVVKADGPRSIHFQNEQVEFLNAAGEKETMTTRFNDQFYKQLCSEKKVMTRKPGGGYESKWVKLSSSTRNEALDMMVYAFGVYDACGQGEWIARKWKEIQAKLKELNPAAPATEDKPREIISGQPTEQKLPELSHAPAVERKGPPQRRKIRIQSPFRRFGGY